MTNLDGTQTAKTFTVNEVHGLLEQILRSAEPQREAQISQYFLSELQGFDQICSDMTIRNNAHDWFADNVWGWDLRQEDQERYLLEHQAEKDGLINLALKEAS